MLILLFIAYILLMLFFPIIGGILSIFLGFFFRKKKALIFLIIGILSTSLFISLYIPDVKNDLYRYYQTMISLTNIPNLSTFYEYSKIDPILQYQNNPIFNLFEFAIAKSGYFYLLPYLTIVICNFCILYPIFDLKEKNYIPRSVSFMLAIGMVSIYSTFYITTYIRWSLACAIFVFCTYCYFIKFNANIRNIWIFLIPLFFHWGIILACLVLLYSAIIKRTNKKNLLYPVPFFAIIFFLSLAVNVSNNNNIIFKIVQMLQGYQEIAIPFGFSNWISYILDLGTIIIFITFAFKNVNDRYSEKAISKFEFNFKELFIFYLFLITSLQIWQRYSLIIGALALILYSINYNKLVEKKYLFNIIIFLCILIRLYFVGYMKFKGMYFNVSNFELWLNDLSYYIQNLFSIYY